MKDLNNYILESKNKLSLESEIKPWYHWKYPTDDCWKDLIDDAEFKDVHSLLKGNKVQINDVEYSSPDDLCADDSIVRERVFDALSKILKVSYDSIYTMWRNL